MKVLLVKDIRNVGRAGEVLDVSDGHAINFLFPRKLAVPATAANVKQAELRKQQAADQKVIGAGLLAQKLTALSESGVTIKKKANDKGHLYDAVGADDIAKATELPEEVIALEKPFKEVGSYEVHVSSNGAKGSFPITIEAE